MPMAVRTGLIRCLNLSKSKTPSIGRLFFLRSSSPSTAETPGKPYPFIPQTTSFSTSPETPDPNKRSSKLVNFSRPSDSDSDTPPQENETKEVDKSKLPPPYNPFDKKPAIVEPDDPTNLQEVFAKLREEGLMSSAVKMFDGLSQDGLTHESLELFSQIKDTGNMPDVVAYTAVIEAYLNAGQLKEAHKVYLRMLVCGVLPNAYTFRVMIGGLVESGEAKLVKEAKKYVGEMVARGMRPNAATCVAVFEGLVKVGEEEEGREMLETLKEKGVVPEEEDVRNVIKNKKGTLISVLFGN